MLSYEEFKTRISEEILGYLPEKFKDYDVSIVPTLKNNEKNLDGLLIKDRQSNIAPNIYVNDFYDAYRDGMKLKDVCEKIAEIRTMTDPGGDVDPAKILEFKNVRDHVYVSLVNYELNRNYISERPYRRFMDLAVIYYINISECDLIQDLGGRMILCITNDLLKGYKVSEEELYKIAVKNTARNGHYTLENIRDEVIKIRTDLLICEGLDEDEAREEAEDEFEDPGCEMLILSNKDGIKGAATMLCKDVLSEAAQRLEGDFYILPSSVDEVFLLPFTTAP